MDNQMTNLPVEGEEAEKKSCGCEECKCDPCECEKPVETEGAKEKASADTEAVEEKPAAEASTTE